MKGLLLKDFYMMRTYCKTYLLIIVLFLALSLVDSSTPLFLFYSAIFCSMIPFTLLAYDERSHWIQYSSTLPYTKAQLVSAKYWIGLLIQAVLFLLTAAVQSIQMARTGSFSGRNLLILLLMLLILMAISSAVCLPFAFKLGVEKGRIAYYVMVALVCAGTYLASDLFQINLHTDIPICLGLAVLTLVSIGLYLLSWRLSIRFYTVRKLP